MLTSSLQKLHLDEDSQNGCRGKPVCEEQDKHALENNGGEGWKLKTEYCTQELSRLSSLP